MKKLNELELGKVDGKAEFSEASLGSPKFFDSFLLPSNVRLDDFDLASRYFIQGFRGTGKTSLLRYYVFKSQPKKSFRRIVLFKSAIDEDIRVGLSKEVGIDWVETDSSKIEFSQDFKTSWKWFILHKIGEMLSRDRGIIQNPEMGDAFLRLLGLNGETTIGKVLGVFPRLDGGNITISGNLGLVSGELSADFVSNDKTNAKVPLRAVVSAAERALLKLVFADRIIIGFDELEAFYSDQAKFSRDLGMVRDLLFAVDYYNQLFIGASCDVFLIAAVRSEVLSSMKALGQEVERTVHDRGVTLSWHHAARSINHPILEMVRRKLIASGVPDDPDPLSVYFPEKVNGVPIENYLLDGSFYKPRDIIWRLTIIQDSYPNAEGFSDKLFKDTETTYSQRMWSEIEYELSAQYNSDEIQAVKMMFSGFWRYFTFDNLCMHVDKVAKYSSIVQKFQAKRDMTELLHNLYRLGAIGNDYRFDSKRRVNRWMFRNETDLLIDKQMAVNSALWRTLSSKTKHGKRA